MSSSVRKVAVVFATRWWRVTSIDFGGYCDALARLGHSPTLVCCGNDHPDAGFPVVEADVTNMEKEEFWRNLKLEAVIFFNWLRSPRIVEAMKRAGLFVISRGDTDGHASARVFPKAAWLALAATSDSLLVRLRKIRYWIHQCRTLSATQDRDLMEGIERADTVVVECDEAAGNLRRILQYYRRPELAEKLKVVPHSVADRVLLQPVSQGRRPRKIICGGRWEDPQKDALLLASVLQTLLKRQHDLQIVIVGSGAEDLFGQLANRYPQIVWLRRVAHEKIPEILADCRIILSASRWEGYSIIALEALCMGCTLAAPPLPGFISMTENGRYGTISPDRKPAALARAVEKELELWDSGTRLPAEISAVWRQRVSSDSVVSSLISLIK